MNKMLLAIVTLISLTACTSASTAERALKSAGHKNIAITGTALWGCSESDLWGKTFVAETHTGMRISGVVCSGWLKGATIRYD